MLAIAAVPPDLVDATDSFYCPRMSSAAPKCWICGDVATTREHRMLRAAARIILGGDPAPGKHWFLHEDDKDNQPLQSTDSKLLKPNFDLCAYCNNTRTQPHDRALEQFVREMVRRYPDPLPGIAIQPRNLYPKNVAEWMLRLHLYYVKKLGCAVVEAINAGKPPIAVDLSPAAHAIRTERAFPDLYLRFGCRQLAWPPIARAKIDGMNDNATSKCIWLDWCDYYGPYAIHVIYAANAAKRHPLLAGAWHPRFGLGKLRLASTHKPIR